MPHRLIRGDARSAGSKRNCCADALGRFYGSADRRGPDASAFAAVSRSGSLRWSSGMFGTGARRSFRPHWRWPFRIAEHVVDSMFARCGGRVVGFGYSFNRENGREFGRRSHPQALGIGPRRRCGKNGCYRACSSLEDPRIANGSRDLRFRRCNRVGGRIWTSVGHSPACWPGKLDSSGDVGPPSVCCAVDWVV